MRACGGGWSPQGGAAVEVSPADLMAAEPDVLRKSADELIRAWNE